MSSSHIELSESFFDSLLQVAGTAIRPLPTQVTEAFWRWEPPGLWNDCCMVWYVDVCIYICNVCMNVYMHPLLLPIEPLRSALWISFLAPPNRGPELVPNGVWYNQPGYVCVWEERISICIVEFVFCVDVFMKNDVKIARYGQEQVPEIGRLLLQSAFGAMKALGG